MNSDLCSKINPVFFPFFRSLLMKTLVPQKADDLFASKDRSTAPEEFVRLFLVKEANAQRLETKTGKEVKV